MDKLTKVTLEELINRKMQAENDRMSFRDVEIPELGIIMPFQKLPITYILNMFEGMDKSADIGENYEKCVELIYKSCPLLHNEKILEGCAEPYDVVALVFNDNMKAIISTGERIMKEFYGISEDEIKN